MAIRQTLPAQFVALHLWRGLSWAPRAARFGSCGRLLHRGRCPHRCRRLHDRCTGGRATRPRQVVVLGPCQTNGVVQAASEPRRGNASRRGRLHLLEPPRLCDWPRVRASLRIARTRRAALDGKPDVCWQFPVRRTDSTNDAGVPVDDSSVGSVGLEGTRWNQGVDLHVGPRSIRRTRPRVANARGRTRRDRRGNGVRELMEGVEDIPGSALSRCWIRRAPVCAPL